MNRPLCLFAFAVPLLVAGCYPLHASLGHLELMAKRQPLAEIVADAGTAEELKASLQRAAAIREFASRELALPDNGSYGRYVELDGDYPLWNVWITPEFDLQPRQSCFPIAGCVPYRGYYSKQLAQDYTEAFIAAGDDVLIAGVTAYSTLGYFDDPLTSTMLRLPEERLAGLIFHELAHQVVYVRNHATFNESFARAVEIEGTLRWLKNRNDTARLARYQAALERADLFFAEVRAARAQLAELYVSRASREAKLADKARVFNNLRAAHLHRKAADPAWAAYDAWFDGKLDNAKLAAVSTYFDDVAMFRDMLRKQNGDFSAFYAAVRMQAAQPGQLAHG